MSYLLLPNATSSLTVVGARLPPFAPPLPLWHRHRPCCNARLGAVTSPACAALRRAIADRAGRALRTWAAPRVAVGHARTVRVGRPDAASVGQAPRCNRAEREFSPMALKLIFLFSEYIQILRDLKICVGFI
jgi:hypothetical protein